MTVMRCNFQACNENIYHIPYLYFVPKRAGLFQTLRAKDKAQIIDESLKDLTKFWNQDSITIYSDIGFRIQKRYFDYQDRYTTVRDIM